MKFPSDFQDISSLNSSSLGGCIKERNPEGEITVQKINYKGWENSMELKNDLIRVIVVPAIGRIMHYSFIHSDNILYNDPSLYGKILSINDFSNKEKIPQWHSFGGDRVWPTEESMFTVVNDYKRPPDHWFDGLAYEAEIIKNGVIIKSQVSDFCGAQLTRKIFLKEHCTKVYIEQQIDKIKPAKHKELESVPLTIWNVTQIKPTSQVLMPLNNNSCFENRIYIPFWDDYPNQAHKNYRIEKDVLLFLPDSSMNQKIGADASGWVAGIVDNIVMAEFFHFEENTQYPDSGTSATAFTCPTFTELECLSPLVKLKTGQSRNYNITWDIHQISGTNNLLEQRKEALDWITKTTSGL